MSNASELSIFLKRDDAHPTTLDGNRRESSVYPGSWNSIVFRNKHRCCCQPAPRGSAHEGTREFNFGHGHVT